MLTDILVYEYFFKNEWKKVRETNFFLTIMYSTLSVIT